MQITWAWSEVRSTSSQVVVNKHMWKRANHHYLESQISWNSYQRWTNSESEKISIEDMHTQKVWPSYYHREGSQRLRIAQLFQPGIFPSIYTQNGVNMVWAEASELIRERKYLDIRCPTYTTKDRRDQSSAWPRDDREARLLSSLDRHIHQKSPHPPLVLFVHFLHFPSAKQ